MNSIVTPTSLLPGDGIESFLSLVAAIERHAVLAGEMLVRLVADDPTIIEKIQNQHPQISAVFIARLLRVGEHSLHPDLLLNGCAAYRKIASLPYAVQEQIVEAKAVDVVIGDQEGDVIRVPLTELTPPQIKQVMAPAGVRSRDEQRAWLKRLPPKPHAPLVTTCYHIRRDKLIVTAPCELNRRQLQKIIEELK